jgi:hypothetical protein
MLDSIRQQTEAFVKGFEQMIPREALKFIDERELSVKLTGISTIDGND